MIRIPKWVLPMLLPLTLLSADGQELPSATDISAIDIDAFIDALPEDSISDRAIRVVDVGDYTWGLRRVRRRNSGRPIRHDTPTPNLLHFERAAPGDGGIIRKNPPGNSRLSGRPNLQEPASAVRSRQWFRRWIVIRNHAALVQQPAIRTCASDFPPARKACWRRNRVAAASNFRLPQWLRLQPQLRNDQPGTPTMADAGLFCCVKTPTLAL